MSDQETAIAPAPPHVDDLTVPWKATSPETALDRRGARASRRHVHRRRRGRPVPVPPLPRGRSIRVRPGRTRGDAGPGRPRAVVPPVARRRPERPANGRDRPVVDRVRRGPASLQLDRAVTAELDDLSDIEIVDVFEMARRLGHRFAITCWFGIDAARGPEFEQMVDDLDLLDGSDAFLPQEDRSERDDDLRVAAALDRIETMVAAALDGDAEPTDVPRPDRSALGRRRRERPAPGESHTTSSCCTSR